MDWWGPTQRRRANLDMEEKTEVFSPTRKLEIAAYPCRIAPRIVTFGLAQKESCRLHYT